MYAYVDTVGALLGALEGALEGLPDIGGAETGFLDGLLVEGLGVKTGRKEGK